MPRIPVAGNESITARRRSGGNDETVNHAEMKDTKEQLRLVCADNEDLRRRNHEQGGIINDLSQRLESECIEMHRVNSAHDMEMRKLGEAMAYFKERADFWRNKWVVKGLAAKALVAAEDDLLQQAINVNSANSVNNANNVPNA